MPAPSLSAISKTSVAAPRCALANEHRDALPGIEHVGGALQGLRRRRHPRGRVAHAARIHVELVGRFFDGGHVLHVLGKDQASHGPLRLGNADGAIDCAGELLGGTDDVDVFAGHVLKERVQVEFLLKTAADRGPRLLADDGQHRLVVQPGVIEAI